MDLSQQAGQNGFAKYLQNPSLRGFDSTHGGINFRSALNLTRKLTRRMLATFFQLNNENMDYFNEAFGGFDPLSDKDAAMKFCLNAVLMDRRFVDLDRLLPDVSNVGGIEGEPGWNIERRNEGDRLGYDGWPESSHFRAFVEPDSFELAFPEFFCDRSTFISLVSSSVHAYCDRHPDQVDAVNILKQLP